MGRLSGGQAGWWHRQYLLLIVIALLVLIAICAADETKSKVHVRPRLSWQERRRLVLERRKAIQARRARLKVKPRPTTPPPTIPPPLRYPGEDVDIMSSCETCKFISAWFKITVRKAPAEIGCLQLGVQEDRLGYQQVTDCTTNLCADMFGKPILQLIRCQNFISSNRAAFATLLQQTSTDEQELSLVDTIRTLGVFCTQIHMCPALSENSGMFTAAVYNAALIPADCKGFVQIVKSLHGKVSEAHSQVENKQFWGLVASVHYGPYAECTCHVDVMIRACVEAFSKPVDYRLRYRCLDLVLIDSRQTSSVFCNVFCSGSDDQGSILSTYGQCNDSSMRSSLRAINPVQ
eukprot:scpid89609/ scgid13542/ 